MSDLNLGELVGFSICRTADKRLTDIASVLTTSEYAVMRRVNRARSGANTPEQIVIAVKVVCHYFPHEYLNLTRNLQTVADRVISLLDNVA
jgi:hypothetical protein